MKNIELEIKAGAQFSIAPAEEVLAEILGNEEYSALMGLGGKPR